MAWWIWIFVALAWVIILLWALSHIIYHRSLAASFIDMNIRRHEGTGYKTAGIAQKKIDESDGIHYSPSPRYRMQCTRRETDGPDGMKVYWVNEREDSEYLIFFLAGGAFIHGPRSFHWNFIDDVCRRSGATAVVPIYHRLPDRTAKDLFPALTDFYKECAESRKWKKVVLLGDSAGANLVFVIAEMLLKEGYPQPGDIISLSPPSGYPLEGHEAEFEEYERRCTFLSIDAIQLITERWSGELDPYDMRVSPYFGDVKGMARTTIFAGERELLYPSGRGMYRKLLENGVEAEFVSGKGMMHDWPVMPVPESKKARRRICDIVLRP